MQRELAREQPPADELVERVVAADVLAQDDEPAAGVEQAGRVEAARLLEHLLRLPEPLRAGR